jgi:hypothetical protein
MIRINDYAEISFLRFVEGRMDVDSLCPDNIGSLIEEYLVLNCKQWNLKFFMKLFQDFLISRNEVVVGEQVDLLSEFCFSSKSLTFIAPDSISKRPYLHPFLAQFITLLKRDEEYTEIDYLFKSTALESYEMNQGLDWWFESVTQQFKHKLIELFNEYSSNTLYHDLYYDFIVWKEKKYKKTFSRMTNVDISAFSFEERRTQLGFLVRSGMRSVGGIPQFLYSKDNSGIVEEDKDFSYIDFLHYLESRNINVNKSITHTVMMKYIDQYCQEFGQNNKSRLTKFAKSINEKDNLFKYMLSLLFKRRGREFSLERMNVPKVHGIILFPKHKHLSRFLEEYWEDIHHLTEDVMDIYYTENDFKSDVSGHKRLNSMPNIKIEDIVLPALLVWQKFGEEIVSINLEGLEYGDIYSVINFFKNCVEKGNGFQQCIEEVENKIRYTIEGKVNKQVEINIQDSQIGVVGDNNILNGVNLSKGIRLE